MIDFRLLKSQLEDVIVFSQRERYDIKKISCEEIIAEWWENKKRYCNMLMQGKLIWESPKPVSISYSSEMQENMFHQFMSSAINFLSRLGYHATQIEPWEDWIINNSKSFFLNTVTSIDGCENTDMKIGMKLIKAFKYFDEFQDSEIRYLQDLASQVIQKTKVEGTLCISIHPLDYMTISENNMNWRSCHALDGEYRTGNLSYMIDPSTVVCYIKSNNYTQLNSFPSGMLWNNKKWRVLLHFQKDFNIVYVNRQYPFSSPDLIYELQCTDPMVYAGFNTFDKYCQNRGFKEVQEIPLSQNYFIYKNHILDPKEVCGGDDLSLQYNDFVYSPHYTPQFIKSNRRLCFAGDSESIIRECKTDIGKRVKCPCCNKNYLEDSDSFICEYCRDQIDGIIGYCEECGSPIVGGDGLYGFVDGYPDKMFCGQCLRKLQREGAANDILEAYC